MLDDNTRSEMRLWLGTMSKRQDLRESPEAMAIEMELIEEALFSAGARSERGVKAIFHHLKTKEGLTYWPNAPQIMAAAKALASAGNGPSANKNGDRASLSFPELQNLEDKVLPAARRWLDIPGLRQHGAQTLEYWGEKP